ncbi:MAG: hypothetical protein ACOYBX_15780 [Mycobacterium sp.]
MSSKASKLKVPTPGDVISATQAAVDAAQAVATGALRIPPASARLAAQLPDLLENLAATTERLNTTMDRLDRYLSLAEPTLRAMDRLMPQLEAMVAAGDEIYGAMSRIPGVSTLSRFAGLSSDEDPPKKRKK